MTELAENRLLDAAELAEILNVKPRWVRSHTANGDIPHYKLGKYPRYRLGRVLAWLEDQERGGATVHRSRSRVAGEK